VSASITLGNEVRPVSFETSESVGKEVDFLLPLALLPAMATGSHLKLPARISSQLFSAVPRIQDVFRLWGTEHWGAALPGAPVPGAKFQQIHVDSEVWSERDERGSGVACFFSGGVDSFYSVLKHHDEVTHLIFVHGFDIPLTNGVLRTQASHMAREVARELGKPLIEVETNLRSFSDTFIGWGAYQGGALASVGLLFQHLFHKVLIPSSHSYADLFPWGSHPLLDPLWSTELTRIEHDGCEATRVEKVAYISRHETAMKWLRVCWGWNNKNNAYNCGHCEKCLRTMVNLRAAGALERCKTLPHNLDLRVVANMNLSDESDEAFARENLNALERLGTEPGLALAVAEAMNKYRLGEFKTQLTLQVRAHVDKREWKRVMRGLLMLLRYHPRALVRAYQKLGSPMRLRRWLRV